jgi:hypothetical protein
MVNGQERWTVGKFHAVNDQRSETFAKARSSSRFKIQMINCILILITFFGIVPAPTGLI